MTPSFREKTRIGGSDAYSALRGLARFNNVADGLTRRCGP
jgi:hypothetical protein